MLTDLQKRKMTRLFNVYDIDGSGMIEAQDYRRLVENFAAIRGWDYGSEAYQRLQNKFMFVWEYMQKFGDPDRSETITLDEFLAYASSLLEGNYGAIAGSTGSFLFDLIDEDSDGLITLSEFQMFYWGYGIEDEKIAAEIFARLDLNGDGTMSADEFAQHGYDFHYSDDPDCPGNWFFGPY